MRRSASQPSRSCWNFVCDDDSLYRPHHVGDQLVGDSGLERTHDGPRHPGHSRHRARSSDLLGDAWDHACRPSLSSFPRPGTREARSHLTIDTGLSRQMLLSKVAVSTPVSRGKRGSVIVARPRSVRWSWCSISTRIWFGAFTFGASQHHAGVAERAEIALRNGCLFSRSRQVIFRARLDEIGLEHVTEVTDARHPGCNRGAKALSIASIRSETGSDITDNSGRSADGRSWWRRCDAGRLG